MTAHVSSFKPKLIAELVEATTRLTSEALLERQGCWRVQTGVPERPVLPDWWNPETPLNYIRLSPTPLLVGYPVPVTHYLKANPSKGETTSRFWKTSVRDHA